MGAPIGHPRLRLIMMMKLVQTEELESGIFQEIGTFFEKTSVASQSELAQHLQLSTSMLKPYLNYYLSHEYLECFMPGSLGVSGAKGATMYYRWVN